MIKVLRYTTFRQSYFSVRRGSLTHRNPNSSKGSFLFRKYVLLYLGHEFGHHKGTFSLDKQNAFYVIWKKRTERPDIGGVTIWSRDGAPSRTGCMRGQRSDD